MDEESPIPGRKYRDIVSLRVVTTILPYHMHSWYLAKGIPYLEDICYSEGRCVMDEYAQLAWKNLGMLAHNTSMSEDEFTRWWSGEVGKAFDLNSEEFYQIYTKFDKHHVI